MALQTSGQISLNEIHVEAGGSSGTQVTINDSDVRDLISASSASEMEFADFYGASNEIVLTSGGTVNGIPQRKQITVSSFISSGGTLRIPSTIWVWSDSTSTAALTIDIPCKIINDGIIFGQGGNGGSNTGNGSAGGPAIKINSGVSGVTITNSSGAYIAGGGGGGGGQGDPTDSDAVPGGGGAGGGSTGSGYNTGVYSGGTLGNIGNGGGGFGSGSVPASPGHHQGYGGCIDAQDGGAGRFSRPTSGGRRPNGTTTGNAGNGNVQGGPGGFWGAAGSNGLGWSGERGSGGAAGAAINDSGNTYTLSNSGTIYGAT